MGTGRSVIVFRQVCALAAHIVFMANTEDIQKAGGTTEEVFLAAYEEYADALLRHVMLRVRDRELAKDIVQEAYSKTWVYMSEGKEIEYLRAFLYRVSNNLVIDWARKKKASSLDSLMEDDGFEPADDNVKDFADVPAAREAIKLLGELDELYRTAITMRYLDEMSPREIAEALGVSENVVSVRIHRGIEKLSKMAKKEPPKHGSS